MYCLAFVLFLGGFFVFASIVALITALPQLISLLISGWKMIQDEITLAEKRQLMKDFSAATKEAVASGDTSKLENIFKGTL